MRSEDRIINTERFVRAISGWVLASALAVLLVAALSCLPDFGAPGFDASRLWAEGLSRLVSFAPMLLISCALTGVIEEFLFRGVLFSLLWKQNVSRETFGSETRDGLLGNALVRAALLSSIVFALAHVLPMLSEFGSVVFASEAPATGDSAAYESIDAAFVFVSVVFFVQIALKFVQAILFGICMAALYAATRKLWIPMLVHAIFDLIYFLPDVFAQGAFPQTYLTGGIGDLSALFVSVVVLLLPTVKCVRHMKDGVLPYVADKNSLHENRMNES